MKNKILKTGAILVLSSFMFLGCNSTNQQKVSPKKSVDMEFSNPQKGKKVYAQKFYKVCGITCGEMAKKHTQDEWEEAFLNGNVEDLISEHCSIMDDLTKKEQRVVYDFMYYHAKDSGHVAACQD